MKSIGLYVVKRASKATSAATQGGHCAGEELHQDDLVRLFIFPPGESDWFEWRNVFVVLKVKLMIELGVPSLARLGQFLHAGLPRRPRQEANDGRSGLNVFFADGRLGFCGQLKRHLGQALARRDGLEGREPDIVCPLAPYGLASSAQRLTRSLTFSTSSPAAWAELSNSA